jgi:hypothetical protein
MTLGEIGKPTSVYVYVHNNFFYESSKRFEVKVITLDGIVLTDLVIVTNPSSAPPAPPVEQPFVMESWGATEFGSGAVVTSTGKLAVGTAIYPKEGTSPLPVTIEVLGFPHSGFEDWDPQWRFGKGTFSGTIEVLDNAVIFNGQLLGELSPHELIVENALPGFWEGVKEFSVRVFSGIYSQTQVISATNVGEPPPVELPVALEIRVAEDVPFGNIGYPGHPLTTTEDLNFGLALYKISEVGILTVTFGCVSSEFNPEYWVAENTGGNLIQAEGCVSWRGPIEDGPAEMGVKFNNGFNGQTITLTATVEGFLSNGKPFELTKVVTVANPLKYGVFLPLLIRE